MCLAGLDKANARDARRWSQELETFSRESRLSISRRDESYAEGAYKHRHLHLQL